MKIGDQVAEAIHFQHQSTPAVFRDLDRLQTFEANGIVNEVSESPGRDAGGEMRGGGSEHIASVKRPADLRPHHFGFEITRTLVLAASKIMESTPLSGAMKNWPAGFRENRPARTADAGVDHDHVNGPFRKIAPRLGDDESGLHHVVGRDIVGDIDDAGAWRDAQRSRLSWCRQNDRPCRNRW